MTPTHGSADLLSVREVARRLAVSERTVWRWVALGVLPGPVRPGRRTTRWRVRDIERYLEGLSTPAPAPGGGMT